MSLIEYYVTNSYTTRTHPYTESSQCINNTHGCYLTIKIYNEDTIDICLHKETRNSYTRKYDTQTPSTTRSKRDKNTDSVPSSIYHNL